MATSANHAPPVRTPAPHALELSHSQFARVHPHGFLLSHLAPPKAAKPQEGSIRANGRSPLEFRNTDINVGSLTHTHGSSAVRIGDTLAVCGIRAEQVYTSDLGTWNVIYSETTNNDENNDESEDKDDPRHIADYRLLVPNVSLNTGCAPGFLPGGPPAPVAQALSHQILSLLTSSRIVRAEDLRIWYQHPNLKQETREGENESDEMDVDGDSKADSNTNGPREVMAFWVLHIDVMMLSVGGNLFDAAWASVITALSNVRLPKAWWDPEREMILCSHKVEDAHKLSLRSMPVSTSFVVFQADAAASWRNEAIAKPEDSKEDGKGRWILADPDGYEEGIAKERVNIVVHKDKEGKTIIHRMEKIGGYSVDSPDLRRLVSVASERWEQVMASFSN